MRRSLRDYQWLWDYMLRNDDRAREGALLMTLPCLYRTAARVRIRSFAIVTRVVIKVSILFPEELHEKVDNSAI
jgi:hypothetical protein